MSDNKGIKISIGFQKNKNRYGGCLISAIARTHKSWPWTILTTNVCDFVLISCADPESFVRGVQL